MNKTDLSVPSPFDKRLCWGEHSLSFYFADIGFRISGLNDAQWQALNNRYRVLTDGEHNGGALETWVYRKPIPAAAIDRYSKNGVYTPLIRSRSCGIEIEDYDFHAALSFAPQLHGVLYAEDGDLLATPTVFENYLRIIAAYATLLRGGLLLHSAGLVVDNRAYLFLGRSGAGKTTLSRLALAAGAKILSDDINIVLATPDGGFAAAAVPFAGEMGHAYLEQEGQYPVAGLFWLEKSPQLACESIAPTIQMAKLFACSPVVNADKHQLDPILNVCAALLKCAPMRLLRFRRDEGFSALYKILGEVEAVA
jgi:hypothetical protein